MLVNTFSPFEASPARAKVAREGAEGLRDIESVEDGVGAGSSGERRALDGSDSLVVSKSFIVMAIVSFERLEKKLDCGV
jgi:hypothetical protein